MVNTGSDNGLLPDGTNPLPEPMLTRRQWGFVAFTCRQFHRDCLRLQSVNISLKITLLKLLSNLPGANELMHSTIIFSSWMQDPIKSMWCMCLAPPMTDSCKDTHAFRLQLSNKSSCQFERCKHVQLFRHPAGSSLGMHPANELGAYLDWSLHPE